MRILVIALLAFGEIGTSFSQAPKIVETSPSFWAKGVNPSTQKEVSVTFDQALRFGFSSWVGTRSIIPESHLSSRTSEDGRTSFMKVTLEPAKVYVFSLNEKSIPGVGFQSIRGVPLASQFLVFQTTGEPKPEDAPPRALSTSPGNASQDVNPTATKGITVSFDKAMQIKKHGFHLFEEKKPVDLKSVAFNYSADGKIFTLSYPLKPSTHYEVEMNSTEDIGFAATNRVPLWPVHFSFVTGQPH